MAAKRKSPTAESPLPRAKKQKLAPKSNITPDESTRAGSEHDESTPTVSGHSSPAPTKTTFKATPKAPASKAARAKRPPRPKPTKDIVEPAAKAIPLNNVMRAKIQQILSFKATDSTSLLERNEENHAILSETAILGALMRMQSDYQLPTLQDAPPLLSSISSITLHSFIKPIGNNPSVPHFILDLSKRTPFEASIHEKFKGHGLDEAGLFEIELELYARDLEIAVGNGLWRDLPAVYAEEESGGYGGEGREVRLFGDMKETGRNGVCPSPMIEA